MFKDERGDIGTDKGMRDGVETAPASFEEANINPDLIRREGFASEAEYRTYMPRSVVMPRLKAPSRNLSWSPMVMPSKAGCEN
jgi:hypothetical protein